MAQQKLPPRPILPVWVNLIAADFDATAEICRQHDDLTACAAFHTCANRIRRAALLPERDEWLER